MLITKRQHLVETAAMQVLLHQKDDRIAELEKRAEKAERAAHEFVEEARYTLEAAAMTLRKKKQPEGEALACLAHSLPYVLSGRRHWTNDPSDPALAESARSKAEAVARDYGFALPSDPTEAVKSLLELSSMLLVPSFSLPVEGLRTRYPLKNAVS